MQVRPSSAWRDWREPFVPKRLGRLFVRRSDVGRHLRLFLYPMAASFELSLKGPTGTSDYGMTNYKWVTDDPNFWKSVTNTLYMSLMSVSSGVVLPFVLATFIHNVKLGKNFSRASSFSLMSPPW
ncbi:hypothetical protein N6H14_26040 [Paenibacillus sp. CC-CFT747]|nr:hypothetical protein N6H14_26040 [Paenibacillus sp. CC-CFT747]